jgi:hypothetical protein
MPDRQDTGKTPQTLAPLRLIRPQRLESAVAYMAAL